MAGWFAIVTPYIPEIINLTRPLFTRSNPQEKVPEVIARQISELQSAATQNAESIKLLATEMQHTIEALQIGAANLEKKSNNARVLSIISATTAALAFCLAAYALSH